MKLSLVKRIKAAAVAFRKDTLQPVLSGFAALTSAIQDWFSGAWASASADPDEGDIRNALTVAVVYDCIRRISTDIAKLSPGIRRLSDAGVWVRDKHQVFSRLIYRPNHFQTWFQFIVSWVCSRLLAGNAYIIKLYSAKTGLVEELIVLDPTKVTPLVASDTGNVFYEVSAEPLARLGEDMVVSAADMIHDRYLPLGHPLIGTSPLERALVAARARQGIMSNAASLNEHASIPPGILYASEGMDEEKLNALANKWRAIPKGRIAVLDQSFKFETLAAKYVDSQSQEIGEMAGQDVCVAFGMPGWKVGMGTRPTGTPEANQIIYYQDCLQWQVEEIEQCLDRGLDIPADVYVELDPSCLLKMDSKTKAEVAAILVKGVAKPDEMRAWFDMEPVSGGDAVYMQQQNFSLDALAKRDAMGPPPPAAGAGNPPSQPEAEEPEEEPSTTADDAEGADARAVPGWVGVYSASRDYRAKDVVTHKRGLWLATQDIGAGHAPGKGEAPGWRLIAGHNKPLPGEGA